MSVYYCINTIKHKKKLTKLKVHSLKKEEVCGKQAVIDVFDWFSLWLLNLLDSVL